ncbi:MAG: O-antigen ligase family protein [Vicinamibacteraceae bacterium]
MIYYGLLLFFILEYVRPGTYFSPINILRLNTIVPLVVVLGSLFTKGDREKPSLMGEMNTKVILFLLGMIAFTVLWAEVTMYAFTVFTTVLGYALVYWVLSRELLTVAKVKGVFFILILVHLILAALTPEMFLDPGERHYIASATFLGDGNDYALSVDIVIPLCLFLLLETRKLIAKAMFGGMLAILICAVVLSQSRGGTMALVAMGLYYWLKSDKKAVTGGLAAVAVVGVLVLAPSTYFERMNKIQDYDSDGSAQGRIHAWQAGTRMAMYNPLGVGAGQFPANYTRYTLYADETRWKTAHSIYFLILGELGFLGLITLLFFLGYNLVANGRLMREVKRRPPTEETVTEARLLASLSAGVLAYAIAGAFLSATYYPHMWVLGGLCVAGRRIVREGGGRASQVPATAASAPLYHPAIRAVLGDKRAS